MTGRTVTIGTTIPRKMAKSIVLTVNETGIDRWSSDDRKCKKIAQTP